MYFIDASKRRCHRSDRHFGPVRMVLFSLVCFAGKLQAAGALRILAKHETNRVAIQKCGGLESLVAALKEVGELALQSEAAGALLSLMGTTDAQARRTS